MTFAISRRTLLIGSAIAGLAVTGGVLMTRNAEAALAPGATAPAFTVQDAEGRSRSLSEFAGRIVVLEWSNQGCPYVRRQYGLGAMQAAQRQAIAQGAVWLTVISSAPGEQGYVTGPQALAHVRETNAAPSAVLLDPTGAMGHAYEARTTPHMFVIDRLGRIAYQGAIDDRATARTGAPLGRNYVLDALSDLAAGRPVARAQTTPYGCSIKYAS